MKDIEIAQNAKLEKIDNIANKLEINEKYLEQYGKYKAKIDLEIFNELKDKWKIDISNFHKSNAFR